MKDAPTKQHIMELFRDAHRQIPRLRKNGAQVGVLTLREKEIIFDFIRRSELYRRLVRGDYILR